MTLLTRLDLRAAFDTIPYNLFVEKLSKEFGISGAPLQLFQSYFTDRLQQVIIEGAASNLLPLDTGVESAGPFLYH